ncbi:hypothetical protein BS47DRAFT_1362572 [Hydnum rufescens UP504]|uniref:Uncharacterized protein n=1 Tax=Hydnum rufescens UP504 TaxID=1448309 RepID=A0A9P6AWF2_9AGAM|nr:hypothetical protein BS47DRAFT_1362572 [Hydnum rufescens UP504]
MPSILQYKVAEYLLSNPTFSNGMMYKPMRIFEADQTTCFYHEMNTGELWNELQIADLKEQYDIMGLASNSCPSCVATFEDLGAVKSCPHCTGKSILDDLQGLRADYPTATTWQFINKVKEFGLAGIENLCWEGLQVDICQIICVDNLHGLHKMFKDHMMVWLTNSIGEDELDCHFMAQLHRVGTRNFDLGISHYLQWSGKGHRDLEHHIIPVIVGADRTQPGVMKAIHALLDFIYIAQYPLQSDTTLDALKTALSTFHKNKDIFVQNSSHAGTARVIEHMNIPKLHALH